MTERMLVIDDEEIVLKPCHKIFKAEGFDAVTTANPQEGLRLVSESPFDVILCDWMMPGFDGMDVVEEIDRRSPGSTVVMISGYPTVGRATEAMKRGAMDFLAKPFRPEEIAEVVKKAVRRSVGLMLVVIAGAELFTGNNLMISSVLSREITLGTMIKRWGLVFLANFIGSLVLAFLFYYSGLWKTGDGALGAAAIKTAFNKVTLSFGEALWRGIGCNWLVCLAVWAAMAARQTIGKVFAIFFPIMAFVAIGFEHCIAKMYFIPAALLLLNQTGIPAPAGVDPSLIGWGSFLWNNLLPVTIGNIIGGAVFVGMSYWGAYLRPVKPVGA